MTEYNKYNIVYRLQKWMDSVPGQTFLNYAYSWGASIVILGTLFKLTHLPGANVMLFIGMGTEVCVFFISAFDRPLIRRQMAAIFRPTLRKNTWRRVKWNMTRMEIPRSRDLQLLLEAMSVVEQLSSVAAWVHLPMLILLPSLQTKDRFQTNNRLLAKKILRCKLLNQTLDQMLAL
jgi:gliding motility-associated protein GldL